MFTPLDDDDDYYAAMGDDDSDKEWAVVVIAEYQGFNHNEEARFLVEHVNAPDPKEAIKKAVEFYKTTGDSKNWPHVVKTEVQNRGSRTSLSMSIRKTSG